MSENEKEKARVKQVERNQSKLKVVNIEELIGENHAARAIWEFVGMQNLEPFYREIRAVEGRAGREAWDPQMLITLWVYAYSRGINSAREISRQCRYEPAFVWITGDMVINHHTLSDFRIEHGAGLSQLFKEVLGAMSAAGLITIKRVTRDGTKIEASASSRSFHREETIRKYMDIAEEHVKQMEALSEKEIGKKAKGRKVASAKERKKRMAKALEELEKVRQTKQKTKEREEARASTSDPDARVMKQANGGFDPSYNVQISTDCENKVIVAISVSKNGNDQHELEAAVQEIERNTGKRPEQIIVDGGYINTENILLMDKEGVELYGPIVDAGSKVAKARAKLKKQYRIAEGFEYSAFTYDAAANSMVCPAGKTLPYVRSYTECQQTYEMYKAKWSDCRNCPLKEKCCPTNQSNGRSVTRSSLRPEIAAFNQRMETAAAKETYKCRGEVAEFPNLWIKEKLGGRRFRLRGQAKVEFEALWQALAYNIQLFIRLTTKRTVQAVS